MNAELSTQTQNQQHTPPRNVVMGIIIFLAVVGVAVAGLSIVQNVRSPFWTNANSTTSTTTTGTDDQSQAAAKAEGLKTQDTDGDGISDFDELYTYKTSPYLKDTDSDGFDDKTEIASGHDPNCAEGQNCFRQDLAPKTDTATGQLPDSVTNDLTTTPIDQALGAGTNPTPDQLRTLLKQQGFTDDQISQFDDATLLSTYQQSVKGSASADSGGITAEQLANYQQLTPDQIRQIALSSGLITQDQLSQIDDATLKDLFLKSIQNSNTNSNSASGQ